jgi:hypothetical protein
MANKKTTKEKGSKNILKLTLDPKRHLSHPYPIWYLSLAKILFQSLL